MSSITALDLFAGTGWGVACQRLGIAEQGVEIMPEAVATREANGMETIYRDVWEGLTDAPRTYDLLIASPPCQTFSMAGNGAGRRALDDVIQAITTGAYKDPAALRAFGETHDPRTALVLTPLAHVWRDRPRLVAFEQVPTVRPVWEACAEVMRGWGYDVAVDVLNAEQYGVPQTRKRAILVARLDGPVALPTPTHSRYYSRDPYKLDPGVLPWVSMAQALGWGMTARPYYTVTAGASTPDNLHTGGTEPSLLGGKAAREAVKKELAEGRWLAGDHDTSPESWNGKGPNLKLTVEEAAILQSYPPYAAFTGNNKLANQSRRPLDQPAPTITAGHDSSNRGFLDADGALTVATVEQVSALQSYPAPFVWKGAKTKQFLQIGNAVPPRLAEAVLSALIA
jgi:DNA (cytosine-5)-methyltransferase 1